MDEELQRDPIVAEHETRPPDVLVSEMFDGSRGLNLLARQEELERVTRRLEKTNRWILYFLVGALLICFLAFVTLVIDAWQFHASILRDFTVALRETDAELMDSRFSSIDTRLEWIEKTLRSLPSAP